MMDDIRTLAADLLSKFAGQINTISIPRPYIEMTGSLEAALLLNQIIYWSDRTRMENGWFAKTYQEWQTETSLTKYQVMKQIPVLKEAGVETQVKRFNGSPTVHYRLNKIVFSQWIVKKLDNPSSSNSTLDSKETLQSSTEITTETTTEKEKRAPKGAGSQPVAKVEVAATQLFDTVPEKGNPVTPPTSATPPKPNSKEAKFRAEWIQNEKKGEALLKAFGWLAFTHPSEMTRASLEDYLEAAKQLMNCPVETIPSLHKFVADKAKAGNWSSFGPLSLAKYYPEFQSLKHKPAVMSQAARAFDETPEPPPLTEAQKAEVRAQLAQARALMGAS